MARQLENIGIFARWLFGFDQGGAGADYTGRPSYDGGAAATDYTGLTTFDGGAALWQL